MESEGVSHARDDLPPSPLVEAARVLAQRGVYSLVWFDEALVVTARFGRLADSVGVADKVCDACLPLTGLESDILGLRDAPPGTVLDLPSIAVVTDLDTPAVRCNFLVFWQPDIARFLMLIARSASRSDVEAELSRQMRARLMAEAELAAKSRALERVNRDLEEFAAVISHDLKAPLRALRYAAQDLESLLEAGDTAAMRERLQEIELRGRRMSTMMTSLLDYASAGRKSEIVEETDLAQLVEAIVGSMHVPDGFLVTLTGDWPRIATVAAALDLVIRNLLDNAIKHHDRACGAIQLDCRADTAGDFLLVTVADDGPGIPKASHAAALLPFRTLGSAGAGHGMGLAFVSRTLATIGGRLDVVSDPAKRRGTSMVVHWPRTVRC